MPAAGFANVNGFLGGDRRVVDRWMPSSGVSDSALLFPTTVQGDLEVHL